MLNFSYTYLPVDNPPALNWTANLRTSQGRSILEWDPLGNTYYQSCVNITYSISWNGGQYNTTDASTSVTREVLHQHGFPYCQTQTVTVIVLTIEEQVVVSESTASNITLYKPGKCITYTAYIYSNANFLTINVQVSTLQFS